MGKGKKRDDRMKVLAEMGYKGTDMTFVLENGLAPGSKITFGVEEPEDTAGSLRGRIKEDGYVKNNRRRRFIMAQTFRMLEHPRGWTAALKEYSYNYTLKMMKEEVRVLSKLQKRDREEFLERRTFFTPEVVLATMEHYRGQLSKYVNSLRVSQQRMGYLDKKAYVVIPRYGHVYVAEISRSIYDEIDKLIWQLRCAKDDYEVIYRILNGYEPVSLPEDTVKCPEWIEAFKGAGAYYTLANMIKYHGVRLYKDSYLFKKKHSMNALRAELGNYEGYQFHGLLKATISVNCFDFEKSVREHA